MEKVAEIRTIYAEIYSTAPITGFISWSNVFGTTF